MNYINKLAIYALIVITLFIDLLIILFVHSIFTEMSFIVAILLGLTAIVTIAIFSVIFLGRKFTLSVENKNLILTKGKKIKEWNKQNVVAVEVQSITAGNMRTRKYWYQQLLIKLDDDTIEKISFFGCKKVYKELEELCNDNNIKYVFKSIKK